MESLWQTKISAVKACRLIRREIPFGAAAMDSRSGRRPRASAAGCERRRVVDKRVSREDPRAVDDFERALRGHMIAKTNRQEKGGVHDAARRPARSRTNVAQRARHTRRVPLFEANGIVHGVGAKACVGTAIAFAAAPDAAL